MKKIKWLMMALALSLFCFPLWAQTEQPDHSEEPAEMYQNTPVNPEEAVPYVPQMIQDERGDWVEINAPEPVPREILVDETDHSEEPAELYDNEPVNPADIQRQVPTMIQNERGEWIETTPEPEARKVFIDDTDHSEEPAELYPSDPLPQATSRNQMDQPVNDRAEVRPVAPVVDDRVQQTEQEAPDAAGEMQDRRKMNGDNSQPEGEVKGVIQDRRELQGPDTQPPGDRDR
jgi:hypothetical protein